MQNKNISTFIGIVSSDIIVLHTLVELSSQTERKKKNELMSQAYVSLFNQMEKQRRANINVKFRHCFSEIRVLNLAPAVGYSEVEPNMSSLLGQFFWLFLTNYSGINVCTY